MMKVLITGAAGQLGKSVVENIPPGYDLYTVDIVPNPGQQHYVQLDITKAQATTSFVRDIDPDVIIHLAAMTDVDGCEREPERSFAANVESVRHLIRSAPQAYFLHISSDYVFNGLDGPYEESDPVNPINVYGKHKLESEKLCLAHSGKSAIIRTNVVFDYMPTTKASFVKWVIDMLAKGEEIGVVEDQWNNPTWTDSLARVINAFLRNEYVGLYHYGGADWLNRYDFAVMIARVFDLDAKHIKPISTADLKQDAPRPLKCGLKTNLIRRKFGLVNEPLEECLIKIRNRLVKAGKF